jgi:hypothetical protein
VSTKSDSTHPKVRALFEEGTLNPVPEKVRDAKFRDSEFFDPRDIVQVKYEMLRRISDEKTSVANATEEYGVSRPTYYQTKASFAEGGSLDWCRKSGAHTVLTSFRAQYWHSSKSNLSRASLFERASWRS